MRLCWLLRVTRSHLLFPLLEDIPVMPAVHSQPKKKKGGGAFVVRFGTQHTKERGKVCLHSLPEEEEVSLIMKRRNLSVVAHWLRVEKCLQTPLDSSTQSSPKVVEDYFWKIVLKRIAVA